jgi:hypothetical protein
MMRLGSSSRSDEAYFPWQHILIRDRLQTLPLEMLASFPNEMVAEHARWALEQLNRSD